jgi:hypothetical protein
MRRRSSRLSSTDAAPGLKMILHDWNDDERVRILSKLRQRAMRPGRIFIIEHVLPTGFHRIRHYGLLANAGRKQHLALARELLKVPAPPPAESDPPAASAPPTFVCRHCGAPMIVIQMLPRPRHIRAPP